MPKKCFLIMPYEPKFDDVQHHILSAAQAVEPGHQIECRRLDENRQAGRIIPRLEAAIRETDMCVADISDRNPNVMWETGYAMALGKEVILISHCDQPLPFDLNGLHHISYVLGRLKASLLESLTTSLRHTAQQLSDQPVRPTLESALEENRRYAIQTAANEAKIAVLQNSNNEFHSILGPLWESKMKSLLISSTSWNPSAYEGAWVNVESRSQMYFKYIDGQLVAPYCYTSNTQLSGVYHDFRLDPDGRYIFARFHWIHKPITGFAFFLKSESADSLSGAWWYDHQTPANINQMPKLSSGWSSQLRRLPNEKTPAWAEKFFELVKKHGVAGAIKVLIDLGAE